MLPPSLTTENLHFPTDCANVSHLISKRISDYITNNTNRLVFNKETEREYSEFRAEFINIITWASGFTSHNFLWCRISLVQKFTKHVTANKLVFSLTPKIVSIVQTLQHLGVHRKTYQAIGLVCPPLCFSSSYLRLHQFGLHSIIRISAFVTGPKYVK